ncbi:MAG: HD domain-containing protein [Bacteroidales bacterium]|jgi:class 3 adenylate cyclase|nr:HD domain-containing protein [Bacteroidales bacterium]
MCEAASNWWIVLSGFLFASNLAWMFYMRKNKTAKKEAPPKSTGLSKSIFEHPDIVSLNKDNPDHFREVQKNFFQKFDMATVLFADIENFSKITDNLQPEALLDELNNFFFYFDTVVERHHIEKIKTMGDAYMCAGGVPQKNHTNPIEVVFAALEVQHYLRRLREQNPNVWSVRMGIHTGEVIAGMLGHKKLSYDIWGHTVNMASRLESASKPGEINISGETYDQVKQFFNCEYHGFLSEENTVTTYYVKGLKPEFIEKDSSEYLIPNHHFFIQLQIIRLPDILEYVKGRMTTEFSKNLYFHSFKHTYDVYKYVEQLGAAQHISDEHMLLLKTAALFHDIGYTVSYDKARLMSDKIAREILPFFQYSSQQIDVICDLMRASHYEFAPNGILEEIIHDANLIYFANKDFHANMKNLFREQQKYKVKVSENEWMQVQMDKLNAHQFYIYSTEKIGLLPD